ncbi:MAG: PD40 domain-containing protein [Anaerolineales bacterium]|nr:PD40 domain-containing protein [Anaerolineales bacterium]
MKKLTLIPMLLAIMACSLFVPMSPAPPATDTLVPFPISPTETLMAVCTPPACRANETYFCNGDCPGGCGTVCATVTPDAAFAPLAAVDGAGKWIVRTEESLAFLDPAGVTSGFLLQRFYAPVIDFVLVRNGNIYSLTDTGDASLELRQVYPRERLIADLDTRRDVEGSPRIAPIFSSDGTSLVWSRADKDGTMTRSVFVTSLETGESREVWRTELPEEAAGHALVPIFYDEARQILVYALHTFYSGMTPTQVASLYLADVSTDTITPLWTLNPAEIYAGVSATVSADGRLLAYLTWGEPQADFTLPWTLHIRDLSNGYETTYALNETWENVEAHLFSPDSNKLLFTASRRDANGDYQTEMLVFDLQTHTWNSIYTPDYDTKPYFNPRAWTDGDWLILTNADDDSTWVMRPNGESLTQITPLEWVGMLEE